MPILPLWKSIKRWLSPFADRNGRSRQNQRNFHWKNVPVLEGRVLLTVAASEQLFLELINRARANPTAEAARLGIDLNEGLPAGTISTAAAQPLAFNNSLQTAIQGHLQDMLNRDFFSHTNLSGVTFDQRIRNAGYTDYLTVGENLAYRAAFGSINVEASVIQQHEDLFVDEGISGRGHRKNILEANFKETGAGVRTGEYSGWNAVFTGNDFGARAGNSFLTGVVITDTVTTDNFYSIGEGLTGVTIQIRSGTTVVASTTSNEAGGYQLQVPPGTYTVTFSGGGIASAITKTFTINSQNVKVDANTRTDVPAGPSVEFSSGNYAVNEDTGTRTITVSLSRAATSPVSVRYATSNGSATVGSDYTAASGTLTFDTGETSKTFSVPIINDSNVEPAETINLTLSNPQGVTLGSQQTSTISIADDDVPSIQFSTATKSASESTTKASVTVTLSAKSTQPITVHFSRTGGTATSLTDFNASSGVLTFAPGETSKSIHFTVVNDKKDEDDETVLITLDSPENAVLGATSVATYIISDNDSAPSAKLDFRTSAGKATSSITVSETAGIISVPVLLSAASERSVTVILVATSGSTATNSSDFTIPLGSVTFAPGETRKMLTVEVLNDLLSEATETIKLGLTSSTASIGKGSTATVLITDNDPRPTVSFSSASSSSSESVAQPGTVRAVLSTVSGQKITVKYSVTSSGTTAKSSDYTLKSGTLTFLPGETEKLIPLLIKNDTTSESAETIRIVLSSPSSSVTLGDLSVHTFSILDDELLT